MVEHIIFGIKDQGQLEEVRNLAPSVVAKVIYLCGMDWHEGENRIVGLCKVDDFGRIKDRLEKYEEFSIKGIGFTLVLEDNADVERVEKDLESRTKTLNFGRYCRNYIDITDRTKSVDRYYQKRERKFTDGFDWNSEPVLVAEVPIGAVLKSAQYALSCYLGDPNEFERLFNCSLKPKKNKIGGFDYRALPAPAIPEKFKGHVKVIEL